MRCCRRLRRILRLRLCCSACGPEGKGSICSALHTVSEGRSDANSHCRRSRNGVTVLLNTVRLSVRMRVRVCMCVAWQCSCSILGGIQRLRCRRYSVRIGLARRGRWKRSDSARQIRSRTTVREHHTTYHIPHPILCYSIAYSPCPCCHHGSTLRGWVCVWRIGSSRF